MKRHVVVTAVVGALLVASAMPSSAQEKPKGASKSEVVRRASGGDARKASEAFGAMIRAIDAAAASAEAVRKIESISSSAIVTVDAATLLSGGSEGQLTEAMERNRDAIVKLRDSVQGNVVLRFTLGRLQAPIVPGDVVAIAVGDDGMLTVYYRKS